MRSTSWERALYINESKAMEADDQELGVRRLNYWNRFFNNNQQLLSECIQAVSNLDNSQLIALASNRGSSLTEHAQWIEDFETLLSSEFTYIQLPYEEEMKQGKLTISFYPFFEPFMRMACKKLRDTLDKHNLSIPSAIEKNMLLDLIKSLYQQSYRTLILELNVARLSNQLKEETPEERYQYFSTVMLSDPAYFRGFCEEYPVLIRILFTKIENWIDHIVEIVSRVAQDRELLSESFFKGKDIGELEHIELGAGDAHKKGKGVALLRFDSGFKLVYKPRSLQIDVEYLGLIQWLNEQFENNEFLYVMKVLDQGNYGWTEYIEYKNCTSVEEVSRFYTRIGNQLALLYILNAVDFHHENLIAYGEYPVMIDLESILHQSIITRKYGDKAEDRAMAMLDRSIQSTGILPSNIYYRDNPKAKSIDVGGLSGADEQLTPFKVNQVSNKNTDEMQIVKDYVVIKAEKNRPQVEGEKIEVNAYLDEIERGFLTVYNWVMEHKEEFKSQLTRFTNVEVRSILRPTTRYGELLKSSYHPDFLRDALDREIMLHRLWIDTIVHTKLKRVTKSEVEDMIEADIPYFSTKPGEKHLWDSRGKCIENCFEECTLELIYQKIDNLNERDCRGQLQILHMTMLASNAKHDADVTEIIPKLEEGQRVSREEYLQLAQEIGNYLLSRAIYGTNNGEEDICWISTVLEGNNEVLWDISPVGNDLYNGNAGVALFLGYLAALTGEEKFKRAAKQTLIPVRQMMKEYHKNETWSVGAYSGVGGHIYTLGHLSALWNDEQLMQEVLESLPAVCRMIPEDRIYDYIGGSAGILRIFLGLYQQTNRSQFLEGAKLCGAHLLQHAVPVEKGIGWRSPWEDQPLTGFSHGVSGVAAVLSQLYAITKEAPLLDAITQALAFEREYFAPELGNWRTPKRENVSVAWCHGAPGVLLGRLMLKSSGYHDELMDKEIEIALQTTLKLGFGNNRSYCHGDLGQIEILQYAAKVLEDDTWLSLAQSAADQVFQVIKEQGWNSGVSRGTEAVGLMVGLSGYGFGFLQQYDPAFVPSLLRLQGAKQDTI